MRTEQTCALRPVCQVMVGMAPFMYDPCETSGIRLPVGSVRASHIIHRQCPMSVLGPLITLAADRLLPLRC